MAMEPKHLQLDAVIGFEGTVQNGLIFHPDGQHLIYPLGSTVVIRDLSTSHSQRFLHGHVDKVSTVTLSPCGRYLASGQVTHMGFTAPILVWDFETGAILHKLELHKVLVQALAFSCEDDQGRIFLASIGGQDDCNLVIWNAIDGSPICGSPAANDLTYFVKFLNNDPYSLVTGGSYNLRVWSLHLQERKIRPTDCNTGQLRRVFTCCTIDDDDETMYTGTATGDVLQIGLARCLMRNVGPKTRFSKAVTSILQTPSGHLIVGAGDGGLAVVDKSHLAICREEKVQGKVTSLTLGNEGHDMFVGTASANIYYVPVATFAPELRNTCHYSSVSDVCFPRYNSSHMRSTTHAWVPTVVTRSCLRRVVDQTSACGIAATVSSCYGSKYQTWRCTVWHSQWMAPRSCQAGRMARSVPLGHKVASCYL